MSASSSNPPFIHLAHSGTRPVTRPRQRIAFVTGQTAERSQPRATAKDDTEIRKVFARSVTKSGVAKGTLIRTPNQDKPVENLKEGDLIFTADHGPQTLRWINRVDLPAMGNNAPVVIKDGALGNVGDLVVSPDYRVLLQGWRSAKIAGAKEVFAAAQHLVNDRDILRKPMETVTYYQLGFDKHEVVLANSTQTESLHPEVAAERSLPDDIRHQLRAAFQRTKPQKAAFGPLVRPEVKSYEARLIRP